MDSTMTLMRNSYIHVDVAFHISVTRPHWIAKSSEDSGTVNMGGNTT